MLLAGVPGAIIHIVAEVRLDELSGGIGSGLPWATVGCQVAVAVAIAGRAAVDGAVIVVVACVGPRVCQPWLRGRFTNVEESRPPSTADGFASSLISYFPDTRIRAGESVSLLAVSVKPDAEDHEDNPTGCPNACNERRLPHHVGDLLSKADLVLGRHGVSVRI